MNLINYNNILYIGDEAQACIRIIEAFNNKLADIERAYAAWFTNRSADGLLTRHDKLQHHIHYHFEGGIAAFKFKNEDTLPAIIRNECFVACKSLAAEQLFVLS
ncbi:hypothetical protein MuYL_3774 [Mucilaginibacter xinganensis]|uniref:Uncharacterized protein n=2 Tax=Mucilaginibacter xinganensis TaxID=1234841 RepID=A0A223P0I0_9SPHI|nr:hypothetical protein MuYL_3774 [Mucilaginibacter xinganensis]